jgi:hypothetical protein
MKGIKFGDIPARVELHNPEEEAAMIGLLISKGIVAIAAAVMSVYYFIAVVELARDMIDRSNTPRAEDCDKSDR